jgi:hypothetical protein
MATTLSRGDAHPELMSTAVAVGLWLRFGFFGGVGLVVVAIAHLVGGDSDRIALLALALAAAALAAFSLHRAWRIVNADVDSVNADVDSSGETAIGPAPAVRAQAQ